MTESWDEITKRLPPTSQLYARKMIRSFRLAPMCTMIKILTLGLLALPLLFVAGALFGTRLLEGPAFLVIAIYSWIWLRFRPTLFVVRPGLLEVVWPLKRRRILRNDISGVLLINRQELRREAGWCMRVGAGGLWGGFGWLWTRRRGIVQMYISRVDRFVWIERVSDRPWLISCGSSRNGMSLQLTHGSY